MHTITAVEAKNHFGQFLDKVQRAPVLVTKKNRPVAVMLSIQDIQGTIWEKSVYQATQKLSDINQFKGVISSFANIDPVKYQQEMRSEWHK
ncbi:hypothetical protein SPONN_1206 [uncultured Candidatus Thioglobus sp.]|nr:hypothetical protein SPONN_1206 [uncultured Candidatus Thioglobus sp.]